MEHSVKTYELEGGARLLSVQIPNTITFYWGSAFRAGYRYVPRDRYEMPHLAEHLAFEGTKKYPDGLKFKEAVERDGTYYNATTIFDFVQYYFVGSKENLFKVIPLNLGQIFDPLYDPKRIAQEKEVITREMSLKKEDDPWRTSYLSTAAMLPDRNPDIDERIGNISKITREDLLEYNAKCYGTANTSFVVAGDFSEAQVDMVVAELNKVLKDRPRGERQEIGGAKMGDFGGKVQAFESYKEKQSTFMLRFAKPGNNHEDGIVMDIISGMLTGGMSARLARKAREAGLTYGISTGVVVDFEMTYFASASQTSLEHLELLVELACKEMAAIRDGDYSDEELARATGYLTGSIRQGYQTPAGFAGWYAGRFIRDWPMYGPEEAIGLLKAVDRDKISKVTAEYFGRDKLLLTLIGRGLNEKTSDYRKILDKHFA